VESLLGRGAFGSVWRGRIRDTGEAVAIKMLLEELANDADVVTRFLQERRALTSLRHPSVVAVRDLVVEGDVLAMVMQLVDGPDLKHYLTERGKLDPIEAAALVADVAAALATAHQASIVHRDVKPANVLLERVGRGWRPLLTDFGVARLADSPSVTRTHQVVGTPFYLAPEVIAGRQTTPAVDVYAAGVMLFELCTGKPPFTGPDAMTVFKLHMDAVPVRPHDMPDSVWTVISGCLNKDPARRPDAMTLATALRAIVGPVPGDRGDGGNGETTVRVRIDRASGTMLLPLVEDAPPPQPVRPAAAFVPPGADAMTRYVPPSAMAGPVAGWDAPVQRGPGYQRSPRQAPPVLPGPQHGYQPQGYTAPYPPMGPSATAPQPERYAPPPPRRPESMPPVRPPRRDEDEYVPPRQRPERYDDERRPRRRVGFRPRGLGCLFRIAMIVAVAIGVIYILTRLNADVHTWVRQAHQWWDNQVRQLPGWVPFHK
jgi:serine/threonine-protein kinase